MAQKKVFARQLSVINWLFLFSLLTAKKKIPGSFPRFNFLSLEFQMVPHAHFPDEHFQLHSSQSCFIKLMKENPAINQAFSCFNIDETICRKKLI